MARYFWRNGEFVDREGREMPIPDRGGRLCAPSVVSDITDYASPIDGRMITTRSQRRDDLRRNGCVEYEPSLSPTKGKIKNARFAKKYGLQVSEEFRA
jgi:hypothetical protein